MNSLTNNNSYESISVPINSRHNVIICYIGQIIDDEKKHIVFNKEQ